MIGRYRDLAVYNEIFKSTDFYRIMAGGLLIPIGYMVSWIALSQNLVAWPPGTAVFGIFLFLSITLNGLPIVMGALKGIIRRKVNVDELVSIAIIACLLNGNILEAALISFIMVLGAFIEEAVSDRARNAIETLVKANPQTAVIEANGRRMLKPIAQVNTGDIAVVKAGDTIPVDGRIIDGSGAIDESLLTGESLPVFRGKGDHLSAGTVNLDGLIRLRVSRTGEDSTIGRIIEMVKNAENSKIETARVVDHFAGYFTPIVLAIAGLTFLATRDVNRAISVLVVGCPCSFLLAGPVATVATVGRAAKSGILVKGGEYLEKIARARTFFFDKTGTLTRGKPVITAIRPADGITEANLIGIAAAVEQGSTHPIAEAILNKAADMGLQEKKAESLTVIPGRGVQGIVDGKTAFVCAGTSHTIDGETAVQVTVDGTATGEIILYDEFRPEIPETVAQLKQLGTAQLAIVSGDSHEAVRRIADRVGIQTYYARLKPEEKMALIQDSEHGEIVFTGDGMNDAPSLKASAVGIAMGLRGSEMALSTADIVLMKDNIALLPFLVRLSRKMTRTIRLNIALSLLINLIAVLMGAMGMLTPVMGAVTHNVGSVLVVAMSTAIAFTPQNT
jgi:Cd2+/Zn2+-exporting ATPase